ncbi:MAG: YigZ family protein [Liquorilactobacillus ghanensis]|uniref:YigZ family protein n=2 Tax=Liquorilactobacillus ghanensis TaxID=399370 RepID=UPI0039E90DC5
MKKDFLTIAKTAQAELIIKKSNFIGIVAKTSNEPAAQEFIEHIKDSHPKARHHCFAAIIGDKDQIQRASDNGEPTGTAGAPILNVLKKQQLHNVTAVVVRYYGGIKLGTGGLIRAYSNATSAAIEQAGIVQQIKAAIITVSLAYHQFDLLNNYFNRRKIKPFDIKYSDKITLKFMLPFTDSQSAIKEITDLLNGQLKIKISASKNIEVPLAAK